METYEQKIVRWSDIIVANSNYEGELNNECLDPFAEFWRDNPAVLPTALVQIRAEVFALQPNNGDGTTVNFDITKQYIQNNYDSVKNHLLNNGYISKPDHTRKWVLNDEGKKMKQLKGHKKYQEYNDKKLKAEIAEMNGKIYWKRRVIFSAIVGVALGILINKMAIKLELSTPMSPSFKGTQVLTPAIQLKQADSTK